MSILSQMTEQLAIAIYSDDKKAISKANGIGPKTAARIILELKDKFKKQIETDGAEAPEAPGVSDGEDGKFRDALAALSVLGYSKSEAAAALRGIDVKSLEIDDIIRLSLKTDEIGGNVSNAEFDFENRIVTTSLPAQTPRPTCPCVQDAFPNTSGRTR